MKKPWNEPTTHIESEDSGLSVAIKFILLILVSFIACRLIG